MNIVANANKLLISIANGNDERSNAYIKNELQMS